MVQLIKRRGYRSIEGDEFQNFLTSSVNTILELEQGAVNVMELPDEHIPEDLDVIYIDSGPGALSTRKLAQWNLANDRGKYDKDDYQYQKYPWSRNMDRDRILAAVNLAYRVTAKRSGKTVNELTTEDFETHGPTIMYTAKPFENEIVRRAILHYRKIGMLQIPKSKVYMYDHIIGEDGKERKIVHTGDQIEGLHFPGDTPPRKVAVVSQAPHMVRILHLLERFHDRIPEGTGLIMVPVPTPPDGFMEYSQMEILGTAGSIWKYIPPMAAVTPHPYETI